MNFFVFYKRKEFLGVSCFLFCFEGNYVFILNLYLRRYFVVEGGYIIYGIVLEVDKLVFDYCIEL